MAAKDETKNLSAAQKAALESQQRAGVENPDVSNIASDAETQKAADAFLAGEPLPGYGVKFVTRGGESVPVVRKLG